MSHFWMFQFGLDPPQSLPSFTHCVHVSGCGRKMSMETANN